MAWKERAAVSVSVALYSPHQVVFEGLTAMLARYPEDFRLVDLPDSVDRPDPDVVLFDVLALAEGQVKPLRYLVEMTTSKVLALSRELRPDLASQALEAGADGFFALGVEEAELVEAVRSAATGWIPGDPGEDPTVGSSRTAARAGRLGADAGLSPREASVLTMIADGRSNVEIAQTLYVSINSVKTYIRTAYRKIDVDSRAAAVAWAINHGFATGHDLAADSDQPFRPDRSGTPDP